MDDCEFCTHWNVGMRGVNWHSRRWLQGPSSCRKSSRYTCIFWQTTQHGLYHACSQTTEQTKFVSNKFSSVSLAAWHYSILIMLQPGKDITVLLKEIKLKHNGHAQQQQHWRDAMDKFVYILCAMQFAVLAVFIYNIGMFVYLPLF